MKKIWIGFAYLSVAVFLVLALLAPRSMVIAQDETPPETASQTGGESGSSAESADESDGGADSGETGEEDGSGSESDGESAQGEESSEDADAAGDETEEAPAEDDNSSETESGDGSGEEEDAAGEDGGSNETGGSGEDSPDGTDGAASSPKDGDDETSGTGSGSPDGESGEEDEDGEDGEEDGANAENEEESGGSSDDKDLVDLVQELAGADAMLVNGDDEPISLASLEAEELLSANASLLSGALLTAAANIPVSIVHDDANRLYPLSYDNIYQFFKVENDGEIISIEIASNWAGTTTLHISQGSSINNVSNVIHTQSVMLTDTVDETGFTVNSYTYQTITLTTPLVVSGGQSYAFTFEDWNPALYNDFITSGQNLYPDGRVYVIDGINRITYNDRDVTFRVNMMEYPPTPTPNPNPTPVPVEPKAKAEQQQSAAAISQAKFVGSPADYTLIPQGYSIGGVAWFTAETGYISIALPQGASQDDVMLMYWDGTKWKQIPGYFVEDGMAHGQVMPELGAGTYILVYRSEI